MSRFIRVRTSAGVKFLGGGGMERIMKFNNIVVG